MENINGIFVKKYCLQGLAILNVIIDMTYKLFIKVNNMTLSNPGEKSYASLYVFIARSIPPFTL
jgi:hypothetical protein